MVLCCSLYLGNAVCLSQNPQNEKIEFPKEKVYLHVNTTLAFVGEYILYSLYCLDDKNLKPSKISKIAYVDLIAENGEYVFQQKLRLEQGRSYSDFFIPTSVPSGNYKLVGYTQWMKNFGVMGFYRQDITIINPYTGDQSVFLEKDLDSLAEILNVTGTSEKKKGNLVREASEDLEIQLNSSEMGKRGKNSFSLRPKTPIAELYNVSISVRKIDALPSPHRTTATKTKDNARMESPSKASSANEYQFLPEIRGALLSGKVRSKETGKPQRGVGVSLSVPGHSAHFKTATTNDNGDFYFSIDTAYEGETAIIQVLGTAPGAYQLEIVQSQSPDMGKSDFYDFKLTKDMEQIILARSFHNQIENAFFSVKPDTIQTVEIKTPFFLKNSLEFNLDDFTRFATLRETVIEIVEHLWINRESPDYRSFKVRVNPPYSESDNKPLVLIDGIQVLDHESLMDFNARQIQTVDVGRNRYVFGKEMYDGVIRIQTKEGNYFPILNDVSAKKVKLFRPQGQKKYFRQTYQENTISKSKRTPDFRYQLMWIPTGQLTSDTEFVFYSSDIQGTFEIVIEGFSENGNALFAREVFYVE